MTLIELLWFGMWTLLGAVAGLAVSYIGAPVEGRVVAGRCCFGGMCGLMFALVGVPFIMWCWTRRKVRDGEANLEGCIAAERAH